MPTTNPRQVFVPTPPIEDPYLGPAPQAIWPLDDISSLSVFGLPDETTLRLAVVLDPDVASIYDGDGSLVLTKAVSVEQIEAWSEQLGKVAAARRAANWTTGPLCPRHGKTVTNDPVTASERNWRCPADSYGCGWTKWMFR
jgi:hypothetical protein